VTHLMAFVSLVAQVYITGRRIGKTLLISKRGSQLSKLITRSHGTLVLFSERERSGKLNTST
jgi:hypothetical protein